MSRLRHRDRPRFGSSSESAQSPVPGTPGRYVAASRIQQPATATGCHYNPALARESRPGEGEINLGWARLGAAIGTAILVIVVGPTVGAATTVPTYLGNPTGVTLGMLGDSITNQSRVPLHQALDLTYRSSIAAYGGATVDSMAADGTIGAMTAKNPAVVVFDLGTADLVQVVVNPTTYPLTAFEADYAAMRAKFKGCVVATTINTHRMYGGELTTVPYGVAVYDNKAGQFNGWLRAHYARVGDWDALTTSWWNAGTWSSYIQSDSVHPTALGQAALALMIRQQADRCDPARVVTGTVTYSFFTNGSCLGSPSTTENVTLHNGVVPDSSTVGPLATASYSFDAVYGGDGNYAGSVVSTCDPFTVA